MENLAESELFIYVRNYTYTNTYGRITVEIDADDNSVYLLIPKNKDIVNTVFIIISVRNGKYGFSYCNEDTISGLTSSNNYSLSEGKTNFTINATNSVIYDVEYEMYKMNQK